MSDSGSPVPPAKAGGRLSNKLTIGAFLVAALVFLAGPPVLTWWGSRSVCPTTTEASGQTTPGDRWEVLRSDCGSAIGIVWQLRLIPVKGVSDVAYEAHGGPKPLSADGAGFKLTVKLDAPLQGETDPSVTIDLDIRGRPVAPVMVVDGKRKS